MVKNFIGAFLFFVSIAAFSQEVSITNNLPSSATAGVGIQTDFTLTKAANMGSFAKFQLDVPVGFTVESIDIKGGNFTFENNRAKVVWVSLPSENTFSFTLKIIGSSSISGNVTFSPQFFYLENNVKKDYSPAPSTVSYSGGSGETPVATNNTVDNSSNNSSVTSDNASQANNATPSESSTETNNSSSENTTSDNTSNNTSSTPPPTETAKTTNTPPPSNPPAAKSNALYYVQIYALSVKPSGPSKFAEFGSIKIVEEGGFYKVLVGSFKNLEEARKRKNEFLARGMQCFVVSYENGVRTKL